MASSPATATLFSAPGAAVDKESMEVDESVLDDIGNNQVRRTSRVHVPSTRTMEANNIGTDGIRRRPRK